MYLIFITRRAGKADVCFRQIKERSDLMKYRASKEERAYAETTAKELRRQINDILVKMDARQLQKILWTIQKKDR
jgi:hypothetical protein